MRRYLDNNYFCSRPRQQFCDDTCAVFQFPNMVLDPTEKRLLADFTEALFVGGFTNTSILVLEDSIVCYEGGGRMGCHVLMFTDL